MNAPIDPDKALEILTEGLPVREFLRDDLERLHGGNDRLALGLLACVAETGGLACTPELEAGSAYPLPEMRHHAAEVEPKPYPPGTRLTEVSYVIRGIARVVNSLAAGDHATARRIAGFIAWPSFRQFLLVGVYAVARRRGETAWAEELWAEIGGALAVESQEQDPPSIARGATSPAAAALLAQVEDALTELVPPGTTFPLSKAVIEIQVEEVDAERGSVHLHLGACRFVEGTQLAPFLERELKRRIPGVQSVMVGMSEL